MTRQIGDDYFNRMFPDQTQPQPAQRRETRADRVLDRVFHVSDPVEQGEHEVKTVKVPGLRADRKKHAKALEALLNDGWELVHVQPRGVLQFGTKDTVTVRRKR